MQRPCTHGARFILIQTHAQNGACRYSRCTCSCKKTTEACLVYRPWPVYCIEHLAVVGVDRNRISPGPSLCTSAVWQQISTFKTSHPAGQLHFYNTPMFFFFERYFLITRPWYHKHLTQSILVYRWLTINTVSPIHSVFFTTTLL